MHVCSIPHFLCEEVSSWTLKASMVRACKLHTERFQLAGGFKPVRQQITNKPPPHFIKRLSCAAGKIKDPKCSTQKQGVTSGCSFIARELFKAMNFTKTNQNLKCRTTTKTGNRNLTKTLMLGKTNRDTTRDTQQNEGTPSRGRLRH